MKLEELVYTALQDVKDPEIPTISVVELGIITEVKSEGSNVFIRMTPTFTGCPAIDYMKNEIQSKINSLTEVDGVEVVVDFEIPWNSNMISEEGKRKIKDFGLAPPKKHNGKLTEGSIADVNCPNCGSENTTMNTMFGPTLCRSIHRCFECHETFEAFKAI